MMKEAGIAGAVLVSMAKRGIGDGFSKRQAFADSAGCDPELSELRDDRWPQRRGRILDCDFRLSLSLLCVRADATASNARAAQVADIVAGRLVSPVPSMQVCRARRCCVIVQGESRVVSLVRSAH